MTDPRAEDRAAASGATEATEVGPAVQPTARGLVRIGAVRLKRRGRVNCKTAGPRDVAPLAAPMRFLPEER